MSEGNNPFSKPAPAPAESAPRLSKNAWIVAGAVAAVILALFVAIAWAAIQQQVREKHKLEWKLAELTPKLEAARSKFDAMSKAAAQLQSRIAALEKEKEQAAQMHQGLEEEMRADLESKDVTISQLQGKLTVNILDRILFDSGEADLKPGGEAILQKIAAILAQHPSLKIHVIGHTDNVPIRAGARSRFASNWELSIARALAAVRFLTERAGVDPRRLGAVGYGEFRPLADNATPEGRARNRRIAITILADELVGADTAPAPNPPAPANPAPAAPAPVTSTPASD
jgi:chemotaxis protein MotB